MELLTNLISEYWSWGVGLLTLAAGLSWLPGGAVVVGIVTSAIKILASAIEVISPIVNSILQLFFWVWAKIIWPTLQDIFDNVTTIVGTSIILGIVIVSTMFYMRGNDDIKYRNLQSKYNSCSAELRRFNSPAPQVEEQPLFNPFSIFKIW